MQKPVEILLIEDDVHSQKFAIKALQSLSNAICVVDDGEEALNFLFCTGKYCDRPRMEKPRLILLDLNLPRVNGLEVLFQIKSNPEYEMIPVVVLTSSHLDREVVQSYRLGANSFIVKEADFEKFSESVTQVGRYWLKQNYLPPFKQLNAVVK